jgi:hypothetical protein
VAVQPHSCKLVEAKDLALRDSGRCAHGHGKERARKLSATLKKHHALLEKGKRKLLQQQEVEKKLNYSNAAAQSSSAAYKLPLAPAPTVNSCSRRII